jgi:hypothetical protein
MLTALTTPSMGAVKVAPLIWAARSARDWAACQTDRCALYTAIRDCRIALVVVAAARWSFAIAS